MPLAFWFWFLMVVWLFWGCWLNYRAGVPYLYHRAGVHVILFLLVALLGWRDFGAPWNSLVK